MVTNNFLFIWQVVSQNKLRFLFKKFENPALTKFPCSWESHPHGKLPKNKSINKFYIFIVKYWLINESGFEMSWELEYRAGDEHALVIWANINIKIKVGDWWVSCFLKWVFYNTLCQGLKFWVVHRCFSMTLFQYCVDISMYGIDGKFEVEGEKGARRKRLDNYICFSYGMLRFWHYILWRQIKKKTITLSQF